MLNYKIIAAQVFLSHFSRNRPVDWNAVFSQRKPFYVEIGFGQGEYLLRCLENERGRNYVGIELDWKRIRKCFKTAARLPAPEQERIRKHLRVLHIDAWVAFERLFRQKTVAGAVCLFPCPWPKDRHEKHRLFSKDFLRLLNSRLTDGGKFQCVTDHWPYVDWILEQSAGTGFEIRTRKAGPRFETKFERKWVCGGQEEFCELLFEKTEHIDIPIRKDADVKAFYQDNFCPEKMELREDVGDGIAVIPKEWVFDADQQKGLARFVVSDEHLTQHLWVAIIRTRKGWCVLRAEGQQVVPTPGVARAIRIVADAAARTTGD